MKTSDVTVKVIADYLRLVDGDYDEDTITAMRTASIAYISNFTGLTEEEMDECEDLYIVVLILCQDMNDNRSMYIDGKELNRTVDTILNMHRQTLIG